MSKLTQDRALDGFISSTMDAEARARFIELLELEQRWRNDIIAYAEEGLGVPLNSYQKKWFKRTTTPREKWAEVFQEAASEVVGLIFGKNISAIGNQSGKTVGIAIKHIWFNKYKIGMDLEAHLIDKAHYSTLNISPHSRQTKACFQHVKDILAGQFLIDEDGKKRLNTLHPLMKEFLVGDNANLGEIRFANKSVMYSVPTGQDQGSSLAGAQFGYISYDECAQSLHLKEELGAKIMSRLIKYGCCLDLISTPEVDSPSHQYYMHIVRLGEQLRDGWYALTGMGMDDNIFISKKQKEGFKAELLSTDKKKYSQVVKGSFVTSGKRFFDASEIENLWKLPNKTECKRGHKYLLSADWGMSDTGDLSVFMIFDYTSYQVDGRIDLVSHEAVQGGTPQMQFALLRTLHEQYTWYDESGQVPTHPKFVMDDEALGGVVIRKMLSTLQPKGFDVEKDIALFETKKAMSTGRDFYESEVDGAIIERNPDFGSIRSYYIEELSEQLGAYHVKDDKLETDYVMAFVMGISFITKKVPRVPQKPAAINNLAGYNAQIKQNPGQQHGGKRFVGLIR